MNKDFEKMTLTELEKALYVKYGEVYGVGSSTTRSYKAFLLQQPHRKKEAREMIAGLGRVTPEAEPVLLAVGKQRGAKGAQQKPPKQQAQQLPLPTDDQPQNSAPDVVEGDLTTK
jgi:hypothetical protein